MRRRVHGRAAFALALLLVVAGAPRAAFARPPAASPAGHPDRAAVARRMLRRAIDFYTAGKYQRAADTLATLVDAEILEDAADRREALRIYGIASLLTKRRQAAERAFRELLRLDSRARLDPTFVRPDVVRFYERVRRRLLHEQATLIVKRGPRGSAAANLLPPWGQFRNGHRTKGWTILGFELACVATSIASAAVLYSARGEHNLYSISERTHDAIQGVNVASLISLGALLLYGAIDGLYYYYRAPRLPAPRARERSKRAQQGSVRVSLAPSGVILQF